ncbi:membrane-spanning 4-domains subfamily A member 8 [Microcaecilia unicolor]|uniref:Membrane-spanning 4-domains subfamily A member 8-like n=1 Tax=Microcaecilia unicolor TaxID=1415580 RepID=A0A6P7X7F9_9AMPH|nr:membrane-spanning 4-domains subfamily A member 8-like [Microcaecilia unicolor]
MNPTVTGANGMVVVTQVLPSTNQHAVQMGSSVLQNVTCQVPEALQKFFKGEPKVLGATQILIGLIQIFFGIVLAATARTNFLFSGVPFWGGLFFIISGSLSVAAQNHPNMCLINGSVGMNIVSSVSAVLGIILTSMDLGIGVYHNSCNYNSGSYCWMYRDSLLAAVRGIEGVLLVLLLLELGISISTSVLGCKASSCCSSCCNSCCNMQPIIIMTNESRPEVIVNPVAPPMYNAKDQYRPEASYPSVPAPVYNECN